MVSAFISPPDILSQLILALVFFVFYEVLIFIGFFFLKTHDVLKKVP